jgi:hypothetical protein
MASLGKISNSLVAAVNENTLALASLNFDFSVVKVEAPKEYAGLGRALGVARRERAENGATHRTARKLGALFEALMSPIPALVAAYGTRCSEIMHTPGVNPSGTTERHGAFAAFVGADATSIWAAATSGATAIGTHLLACLLARSFSDPAQAVSVWAELVAERQREIMAAASYDTASNFNQFAALNAANQEIVRDDLRIWDASARAWLQTADLARTKEYTQLKLILKNITLSVTGGAHLYEDVIRAWRQAMIGLECLLNGQPQSVTDGGILLAISSWHLFPNLIVLGPQTTNVNFADPLMPPGSLLTVGITTTREGQEDKPGIYWSVALSHSRFYGKPVKAVGEIDDRLTMDELQLVALGSLLRQWDTPRRQLDLSYRWFVALWKCIEPAPLSLPSLRWLELLAKASKRLLSAEVHIKKDMTRLVDFGYRRGRNFLFPSSAGDPSLPWFGLRWRYIMRSLCLKDGIACAVEYLRGIAEVGGLGPYQALIAYVVVGERDPPVKRVNNNYFTAVGKPKPFIIDEGTPDAAGNASDLKEDIVGTEFSHPTNADGGFSRGKEPRVKRAPTSSSPERQSSNHYAWEGFFSSTSERESNRSGSFASTKVGSLRFPTRGLECYRLSPTDGLLYDCKAEFFDSRLHWIPLDSVLFKKCATGPFKRMRMYITRLSDESKAKFVEAIARLRNGPWDTLISLEDAISILEDPSDSKLSTEFGRIDPLLVWQFFEGPDFFDSSFNMKAIYDLMMAGANILRKTIEPLEDLAFAQDIYEHLDGATVSSSIVEHGIHRANWGNRSTSNFPYGPNHPMGGCGYNEHQTPMSRAFSCIAMMETGTVRLNGSRLAGVFALSSSNSIFVSSRLLTDPSTNVADNAVTHIIGNVGRPGLSLLIPPATGALVRSLSSSYRAVSYEPFDGKQEDNFKGTSLHLSFTSHQFPLDYGAKGIIDHQVFLVESVISVHDSGQWVGDLNVNRAFASGPRTEFRFTQPEAVFAPSRLCKHTKKAKKAALDHFSTVDTWEEVLDTPPSIAVVRAHKNWFTRLAAFIIINQGQKANLGEYSNYDASEAEGLKTTQQAIVLKSDTDDCWACIHEQIAKLDPQILRGSLYIIA